MIRHTTADRLIGHVDAALRTVSGHIGTTRRPSPGAAIPESELSESERTLAGRLMRINHCGEVCAQALYHGQALTARTSRVTSQMQEAAAEETDHLSWCETRIRELDTHVSVLNPLWYAASFGMGVAAGAMGDRINLGFVAATEHEVCKHLDEHLERLPGHDQRSREILTQMREDEARHEHNATDAGGVRFPPPVRHVMKAVSALMTRSTYWI